jgi:hypothetical protein
MIIQTHKRIFLGKNPTIPDDKVLPGRQNIS